MASGGTVEERKTEQVAEPRLGETLRYADIYEFPKVLHQSRLKGITTRQIAYPEWFFREEGNLCGI